MTRILGIAPYEGLKYLMESMAQMDEEISLVCYIGDYKDGLEKISDINFSDYDVIISRGGTADLLRESAPIPVLSIGLSYYDILNATTLAQSFCQPLAFVGFPSTVRFASMLYDILKLDIPIYTVNNEEEVKNTLVELQKQQIFVVIGDNMITQHARELDMQAILIASGSESVAETFRQAVMFSRYQKEIRRENAYYQAVLGLTARKIMILDQAGKILFTDLPSSQKNYCGTVIRKLLPAIFQQGKQQAIRRVNNKNMMITAEHFFYGKEQLIACEVTALDEYYSNRFPCISIMEQKEIPDSILHLFYNLTPGSKFYQMITPCLKARSVILSGESGTGKDEIAGYLYRTGLYSKSVLFTVNCESLTKKEFQSLFYNSDSPLFLKGHVFYFRHFHCLSDELQKKALRLIKDGNTAFGNQLLFSVCPDAAGDDSTYSCAKEISDCLSSVLLPLLPLRKRIHEIPAFIALYLKELAAQSIYQIAGIEPEGINYLQSFFWEGNFRQFVKVLDILSQITSTSYIQTGDVLNILATEQMMNKKQEMSGTILNINQPLDDIISDVIHRILKQKGMNKTKAARQLGICRTTLWKYLKS